MAFIDPQAQAQMQGWNQAWAQDGKCRVHFYKRSVLDERETFGFTEEREVQNDDGSVRIEKKRFAGKGRPIYKEAVYIKKFTPGDPTNIIDREKWPADEDEFPHEWARYLAGDTEGISGTPIEMLPGLPPPRIEELKHLPGAPVRTIEELAAMSDGVLQRFTGLQADRQRARDWVEVSQKQAPLAEARAIAAEKQKEIDELKERLSHLEALVRQKPGQPDDDGESRQDDEGEPVRAQPPVRRRKVAS